MWTVEDSPFKGKVSKKKKTKYRRNLENNIITHYVRIGGSLHSQFMVQSKHTGGHGMFGKCACFLLRHPLQRRWNTIN